MSPRRAVVAAATGALTLTLAACDPGDAEPTAAPSSVASSTTEAPTSAAPTEEPTSAAPEVPAPNPADFPGMDQQTEEGAKQAYVYFWNSYVFGKRTGDAEPLASVSTDNCGWCSASITDIRSQGAVWSGGTVDGGELLATYVDESHFQVYFAFALNVTEIPSSDGGAAPVDSANKFEGASNVVWDESRWVIDSVDVRTND